MPAPLIATPAEIALIREMRAAGRAWDTIAALIGVSRDWCRAVGDRHRIEFVPPPKEAPPLPTPYQVRASAGTAPPPPFHPIAAAELRRARKIEL